MNPTDSPNPIVRRALVGLAAAALAVSACAESDGAVSSDRSDESVSSAAPTDGASVSTDDASVSTDDASDGDAARGLQQNGPITLEGDVLDPFGGSIEDPAVGQVAPVISGESFDMSPITIGGPTDNTTLVVFLAHWCPHCNDEIPELIELFEAGDLPEGLDVIGVSTSVQEGEDNYPPSDWTVEKGWPWPMMADDEELTAVKAYGGTSFPFAVVLDADGTVLARRAGQATAAETKAFLDSALAG